MDDVEHMRRAMALAAAVRSSTAPNPWVGSVVVAATEADHGADRFADADADADRDRDRADGATHPFGGAVQTFAGATAPPGGPHAEIAALRSAGDAARGATLYTTLEPCVHHGRTPPCTDAIVDAGIARVVIGVEDPDPKVAGRGIAALRDAGIDVVLGVAADEVAEQLAPYRKHRTTGQPWVILKMAASLASSSSTRKWSRVKSRSKTLGARL